MQKKDIFLTKEGFDKLKGELEYLKIEKRDEIMNTLKEARALGDLSENAEYDSARGEQANNEKRIREIEYTLEHAKIIEEDAGGTDTVNIGSEVVIQYEDDEEETYKIVGSAEADPFENKISNESPIASAILDKKAGAVVDVESPNGIYKVKIVRIC